MSSASTFHGKSTSYIPRFLWRLWLSDTCGGEGGGRLHIYDVNEQSISEEYRLPVQTKSVFEGLLGDAGYLGEDVETTRTAMGESFERLEEKAENVLVKLLNQLNGVDFQFPAARDGDHRRPKVELTNAEVDVLRKYLVFIRFRNGQSYQKIVKSVQRRVGAVAEGQPTVKDVRGDERVANGRAKTGPIRTTARARRPTVVRREWFRVVQRICSRESPFPESLEDAKRMGSIDRFLHIQCFTSLLNFLQHNPHKGRLRENLNVFEDEHLHTRNLDSAEVFVGLAAEGHEFVFTDEWYYALADDADAFHHYVFPLNPKVALYLVVDSTGPAPSSNEAPSPTASVGLACEVESPADVQQRNEMVVHRSDNNPAQHIYFSSLTAMIKSIFYYDERISSNPDNLDYGLLNRFRMVCRNESILEGLRKTLCLKGSSVYVTDLTDEIVRVGDSAIGLGSFADVWKGVWVDGLRPSTKGKFVAVKVLRQVMAKNEKEKLMSRLKDEVVAWHRLRHPHIQPLHGVIQLSGTLAMVSPWRDNGTITHYLNSVNPSADRLDLLTQVASGMTYLHSFQPIVIHGDLKGGNILIDEHGTALISDFGLSRVVEDFQSSTAASSFFAGSTRWMAPELVFALVEDTNGTPPPITVPTDVYAFGSLVLEVGTGQSPYPECKNEHAVTVAILRGISPSQGSKVVVPEMGGRKIWEMVERCWAKLPQARPTMADMFAFFQDRLREHRQKVLAHQYHES